MTDETLAILKRFAEYCTAIGFGCILAHCVVKYLEPNDSFVGGKVKQ
jgi:hypothetical protein